MMYDRLPGHCTGNVGVINSVCALWSIGGGWLVIVVVCCGCFVGGNDHRALTE